ncbi:adenylate/guanylate cyclase domain-containing protein [Mycobacterium kyorinense]|uniref:Adenylate cyclase n=1 Tax=Mycobacterium kyorinense TaxID=487514 RepID=A0A1X1XD14_9MYCO|nr:adenylate/guanylate cyclase domain-containing protein [Mycobacterium kyorinense]ORV96712.1 adenylate cyclase [Mycobacterium kyorinense]
MAAKKCSAPPDWSAGPSPKPDCVAAVRTQSRARTQHYVDSVSRRLRVLKITAWIGAAVLVGFAVLELFSMHTAPWIPVFQLVVAAIYVMTPMLYRFGELVAPLTFVGFGYATIFVLCWTVGTGSGLQYYFLVAATLVVLTLGIEHIVLAATLAGIGAVLAITVEFLVPYDTGVQPPWAQTTGFVVTIASACVMVVATVWYALREIARAEAVMEAEYERSETLLANIMPASIAARLKDPARNVIADKYDEASVLFADIAGFTERASDTNPAELVRFLDRLYTDFDALVDKHRLEKIKVSGDSYMVVSGVPWPRRDHVEALAQLALDMKDAVADLKDPQGRPVPLRIGLATGPVVAGVVGSRRFFYDVWGDAVNVASRMESTDAVGRIQVPEPVYERLKDDFLLEERGDVAVKGKGVMRTWYLVGRRPEADSGGRRTAASQPAGV